MKKEWKTIGSGFDNDYTQRKSDMKMGDAQGTLQILAAAALGLAVIAFLLSLGSKGTLKGAMVAAIASVVALIGLAVYLSSKVKVPEDTDGGVMSGQLNTAVGVEYTAGFYCTIILLLVGAFFAFKRSKT